MKQSFNRFILLAVLLALAFSSNAINVHNMPIVRIQPNGDTLRCYVTGDEYYHRLHDAQGYTIIRNPRTGYFVYALPSKSGLLASNYIAGKTDPATLGIPTNLTISAAEIQSKVKMWKAHDNPFPHKASYKNATTFNQGSMNNLVIFIRFSDEDSLGTTYSAVDSMFNATNAVSMHNYYQTVTYGKLSINTTFYPSPDNNRLRSYQDSHPRSYYEPYDSTTNANGYNGDRERMSREYALLENAIEYVKSNYPVPSSLNIDWDNDGNVDNICFVVSGTYTGWSDLLWPHKSSLYSQNITLNNKRVNDFNLQLEGSGYHYFSVSTFCHEMFHTLGAPDAYHYYYYTNVHPAGSWDLMEYNSQPPQQMCAYMKFRYGNWIDSLPEIVNAGTYDLRSLGSGKGPCCYRIASQDPNQYYVLEYRNRMDSYENALPSDGLLIWRVNANMDGNAYFGYNNMYDELYLFRPNATNDTMPGYYSRAAFSRGNSRTQFNSTTNPPAWTTGGILDTTIFISNISEAGDSLLSFVYANTRPVEPIADSGHCDLTIRMTDNYSDSWNGAFVRFHSPEGHLYGTAFLGHNGLNSDTLHVHVNNGDSIIASLEPGRCPTELSFTISNALDETLYTVSNQSEAWSQVITDACPSHTEVYDIHCFSSNPLLGNVTGAGSYALGHAVTLTATNRHPSYATFLGWRQGDNGSIVRTDSVLNITVTQDTTFTAVFSDSRHYLTALCYDPSKGIVTGSGYYFTGDSVMVTATASGDSAFGYWRMGNDSITQNPYTFLMPNDDATIVAYFSGDSVINHVSISQVPEDNIRVFSRAGSIFISGAEGQYVDLFNIMGRPEALHILCHTNPQILTVKHSGVYILRVNGHIHKVVVLQK